MRFRIFVLIPWVGNFNLFILIISKFRYGNFIKIDTKFFPYIRRKYCFFIFNKAIRNFTLNPNIFIF